MQNTKQNAGEGFRHRVRGRELDRKIARIGRGGLGVRWLEVEQGGAVGVDCAWLVKLAPYCREDRPGIGFQNHAKSQKWILR